MALTEKGEVYTWGSNASGQVQPHKKNRMRTFAIYSDKSWRGGIGERINPLFTLIADLELKEMVILYKVGRTVIIPSRNVQRLKRREPHINCVSIKSRRCV